MTRDSLFVLVGLAVVVLGLHRLVLSTDLVRRVVAFNVAGSGVFLLLVSVAWRNDPAAPDPLPHALVLTGIVVAVSITAVALALVRRVEDLDPATEDGAAPPPAAPSASGEAASDPAASDPDGGS